MKPDMLGDTAAADLMSANMGASKMHILEAGKGIWDVIGDVARSGHQEEAFYVLDAGDIVRKHKEWKLKLPRVQPFYAVKCNDNRNVLEVLASLGANFDCASKSEIAKVLDLGVDTDRIIFANPAKQLSHIRYAAAVNVRAMTFDNESELYKVKEHHPTAKMVLRIRCDAKKVQCPLGIKFGAFPKDAPRLVALCRQLNIDLVGVSFHVGSGCAEADVFRRAVSIAREIFDYATQYGYTLNLVDLGGGYPGNRGSSINEIANVINSAIDEYFPEGCGVDIIAEPGRYYVASAFTLATRIHGRREITNDEDNTTSYMYYINDGVYGSFNCMLYDHAEVTPQLLESHGGPLHTSSIWGPTCDGLDRIAANAQLPVLDVGDWFVFEDMGAYTLAAAGTFNGFPVPKVFPVAHQHTWLYLLDLLPLRNAHFTMETPTEVAAAAAAAAEGVMAELPLSKSCGLEMYNASMGGVGGGQLPSSMSSASIVSLDTDPSDAVSTSSDDGSGSDYHHASDSVDFLADLLEITPVM